MWRVCSQASTNLRWLEQITDFNILNSVFFLTLLAFAYFSLNSTIHTLNYTCMYHQNSRPPPFKTHKSNSTVLHFPQTPSTWSHNEDTELQKLSGPTTSFMIPVSYSISPLAHQQRLFSEPNYNPGGLLGISLVLPCTTAAS